MKISKTFYWEMGHRLLFHTGKCINVHGHSYRAEIIFEGEADSNGILIDFYDIKKMISPFIDKLDHSCMVYKGDVKLINALNKLNSKLFITENHPTAENIADLFLEHLKTKKIPKNITSAGVKIYETSDSFAEAYSEIRHKK